jgi:acyl-CoA thioesterase FadM
MNVMWYTHLFGRATVGFFELVGMDHGYFTAHHAGSFALAQYFSYRQEVRVGEHVTLRSRLLGRSAKKFHVIHFMSKTDGDVLAATGEFLGAHIDMKSRRTSPFLPHIAESIDRVLAEHRALDWDAPLGGALHV